jgi:hypothetical protein
MQMAFEGRRAHTVPMPEGGSVVPPVPVDPLVPVQATLRLKLEDAINAGRLELTRDSRGLVVSLPESATFSPASTEVTDGARELIARVAAIVQASGHRQRADPYTEVPFELGAVNGAGEHGDRVSDRNVGLRPGAAVGGRLR